MKTLYISLIFLLLCLLGSTAYSQVGNTVFGNQAAPSISTGDWLTVFGDSAGYSLTSALYGVYYGKSAGKLKNNDSDNTIIGAFANDKSSTGVDNVYIGARVARAGNGTDNTVIGNEAGTNMTTAGDATIVGETAGYNLTTGFDNTFIGEDAGYNTTTAGDNTFIGSGAGRQNQTGYRNTAVGNEALYDLGGFSGSFASHHNTAVGDSAGIDNGEGIYNTFIGAASGAANEYADHNTFIGGYAGYDNNRTNSAFNANRNTYLGFQAGYSNRAGEDNVGVGAFANYNNTLRSRTTFVGAASEPDNNDVVVIGYSSRVSAPYGIAIGNESESNGQNSIAIGYQAQVASPNEVVIGNGAMKTIGGAVNWTAFSDGRVKSSVKEDVPGLAFIKILRPVTYIMDIEQFYHIKGQEVPQGLEEAIQQKKSIKYSGFVAQEVAMAAASIGYDFSGVRIPDNPDTDLYGLRYAEFVVPMVKAIQELSSTVERQEELIDTYEKTLAELSARLSVLENSQSQPVSAARK